MKFKHLPGFFIVTSCLLASAMADGIQIEPPPELKVAPNVHLSFPTKEGEVESKVDLKKNGVLMPIDELVAKSATWIVFDWNGEKPRQVLQIEDNKVLFFSEPMGHRYRFRVPIGEFLKSIYGNKSPLVARP